MRILKLKIIIHDSLGPPKSSTQMACRSVEPLLKGSLLWQIDRPTTRSVKELTTPSVKNNYFTLGVVGRYTSTETFHRSIPTPFSHTRILLHCGGVQILKPKKNQNRVRYLRLKTELNWTEIEKSKPTQPYLIVRVKRWNSPVFDEQAHKIIPKTPYCGHTASATVTGHQPALC